MRYTTLHYTTLHYTTLLTGHILDGSMGGWQRMLLVIFYMTNQREITWCDLAASLNASLLCGKATRLTKCKYKGIILSLSRTATNLTPFSYFAFHSRYSIPDPYPFEASMIALWVCFGVFGYIVPFCLVMCLVTLLLVGRSRYFDDYSF